MVKFIGPFQTDQISRQGLGICCSCGHIVIVVDPDVVHKGTYKVSACSLKAKIHHCAQAGLRV